MAAYDNSFFNPSTIEDLGSLQERFWNNVTKTATCWLWTSTSKSKRYGRFTIAGKRIRAHRVAYELTHGPILPGLHVCHHCDTPPCVRPEHLFLGTRTDNMQDMARKGRHWTTLYPERVSRGETHYAHMHPALTAHGDRNGSRTHPEKRPRGEQVFLAKLTDHQVKEIRRLHREEHLTQAAIGKMFDISHRTISLIVRYKTWRHVPDD